jgi:hypothetical protein
MGRKKPFSGKKKRQQIQDKRERKRGSNFTHKYDPCEVSFIGGNIIARRSICSCKSAELLFLTLLELLT